MTDIDQFDVSAGTFSITADGLETTTFVAKADDTTTDMLRTALAAADAADSAADLAMQAAFEADGAIYPRVTESQIAELMRRVRYASHVVPGTTTTLATAFIAMGPVKFTLSNEYTACVDPRNFNADKGAQFAIEKAQRSARTALWQLEGYALAKLYESKEDCAQFDFGEALRQLKNGERVTRRGWNGKGLWLAYVSSGAYTLKVNHRAGGVTEPKGDKLMPWLAMRTSAGGFVPWLASQSDLLSADWTIVND